jgi:hypothetical protein
MTIDCGYIFDAEAVTSADIQSETLDTGRRLTILGVSYVWTGNIVMTFKWRGRNLASEDWADVKNENGDTIEFATNPAGSASNAAQSFKDAGFRFYQVYGTYTSGAGTVSMYANTKVEF